MSEEQEKAISFMQKLDQWTESNVIGPILTSETDPDDWATAVERVKKAIRAKVLESYRNGQVAGPRVAREPQRQRVMAK